MKRMKEDYFNTSWSLWSHRLEYSFVALEVVRSSQESLRISCVTRGQSSDGIQFAGNLWASVSDLNEFRIVSKFSRAIFFVSHLFPASSILIPLVGHVGEQIGRGALWLFPIVKAGWGSLIHWRSVEFRQRGLKTRCVNSWIPKEFPWCHRGSFTLLRVVIPLHSP